MNDQPVTPTQMAEEEGLGRTTIYEEIKAGRLNVYRVRRKSLVSPRARAEWRHGREVASARERVASTVAWVKKLELASTVPVERKRLADELEEARSRANLAAQWLLRLEVEDTVSVRTHEQPTRAAGGSESAEVAA